MGDVGNILASAGITGAPKAGAAVAPIAGTFMNRASAMRAASKGDGGARTDGHRVTQYARVPFSSSARAGGLCCGTGARATTAKGADYEFAKFNHEVRMVQYSDQEWDALGLGDARGHGTDPDGHVWTREETDQLFNLALYAMRWPVISDRFSATNGLDNANEEKEATFGALEQLKHRFYSVAKLVLEYRYSKETKTGPAPARVDVSLSSANSVGGTNWVLARTPPLCRRFLARRSMNRPQKRNVHRHHTR